MTLGMRVAKTVFIFLMRFSTVPEKHLGEVWVRLPTSPLNFFRLASLVFFVARVRTRSTCSKSKFGHTC